MLETIILIFVCLWALLYYKVRDIFAPWSMTLLIWVVIISGYLYIDHGLYKVTDQFGYAIFLWCMFFCFASFLTYKLTPSYEGPEWSVNVSMVKLFAIAAVFITPIALYKAISFAMESGELNIMYAMRVQVVDDDSGFSLGPLAYFEYVVYVLLFISADAKEKLNKKFFFFCMLINFIFFLVIMSKLILFIGFLSTLYLFYVHNRIKLRTIVILCIGFAAFGLLFTQFRSATDGETDSTFTLMELLGMYIFSPIVAFCYENPDVSQFWGYETFRPVYHILEVLGYNNHGEFEVLRPYVYLPIPTNVYTVMAPFFNDFGYEGVAFFGAFEGAVFAWVYKKASTGHTIARNLYAYFVVVIALQFFDEHFFSGFSKIVQMTILILLCHTKFTWKPKEAYFIAKRQISEKCKMIGKEK